VVLGFPGVTFANPDRFSLEVLRMSCPGRGGAPIQRDSRRSEPLAYGLVPFR